MIGHALERETKVFYQYCLRWLHRSDSPHVQATAPAVMTNHYLHNEPRQDVTMEAGARQHAQL